MSEPVESLFNKDGTITVTLEFYALTALKNEILWAIRIPESVDEGTQSMLIKLVYPDAKDGFSVPHKELMEKVKVVFNALLDRLIAIAPCMDWPDEGTTERIIAAFNRNKM